MRRGLMQDIANTACQMMIGWRIHDDVPWFVQQSEGNLRIDLLSGDSTHDGTAIQPLWIAGNFGLGSRND